MAMEKYQPSGEEVALKTIKERIELSLREPETRQKVKGDFTHTFHELGLSPEQAKQLCENVFSLLSTDEPLPEIETEILHIFEGTKLKVGDREENLIEVLHEKLGNRARIIASQVSPYLRDIKGKVIDYGAGDGQVTQILHDKLGLDIEGVDVRSYKASEVSVPVLLFNGRRVDVGSGNYEAGLLANILHHEKDNENILNELDRIVRRRLVIIETVPVGETEDDMEGDKNRTFMNDYLYNRLFHNADVPVPGTFETPGKWIERFTQYGWKLVRERDLKFDQPTIKDRHYLLVFEK
ncbi:MAG: hypothetical protein ABSE18_01580 [Minisyncoccia bacterium]|jgi:hypothetical protein